MKQPLLQTRSEKEKSSFLQNSKECHAIKQLITIFDERRTKVKESCRQPNKEEENNDIIIILKLLLLLLLRDNGLEKKGRGEERREETFVIVSSSYYW